MKHHASLNRIYRLVWSQVLNSWIAVAETCRGFGKGGSRKAVAAVTAVTMAALPFGVAQADPSGGQVTSGSATISQSANLTTINQATQNASLSWQTFNVAANQTVNFVQPNSTSVAVNRIYDTNGSQIMGNINANGKVFLINPNGILFGQGAQINVGGLIASTLNMSDESLNSAARSFSGNGTGSIINQGKINTPEGGYVALLGNTVSNQGTINSPLGTVALGAGSAATLTFDNNNLVQLQIDQSTLNNLAENKQLIKADGGIVLMSAGAKDSLLASVVSNTGIIEAHAVENRDGTISLIAGTEEGTVNVAGTLDASAPNGGKGGFIETSGARVKIADNAKVITLSANGKNGTWLIDPVDFTIAATAGDISGLKLSTMLGNNNVTIQTATGVNTTTNLYSTATVAKGDINVNDSVTWSANKLTLRADNNININANLNATGGTVAVPFGTGTGSLALEYGQATPTGNTSKYAVKLLDISPQTGFNTFKATVYLPEGPNFSTKLGSNGVTTPYSVITSLDKPTTGLLSMTTGNFVLGNDLIATGVAVTPIGAFSGTFDGLGHTITGVVMHYANAQRDTGLFQVSAPGSIIQNVGLVGGILSAGVNTGGLVGTNNGTISNSYNTGTVTGEAGTGGLVGANKAGTVSNSYASGVVIGAVGVGGLVGENLSGLIERSYATGTVTSTGASIGGLVGMSVTGNIADSFATGIVRGAAGVGGLLGETTTGNVTNSYATGLVYGATNVGGLVGLSSGNVVSKSYATGNVAGTTAVGGLVGKTTGTVSESYAVGNVSGITTVGGLVADTTGPVLNTYAMGSVTGTTTIGGLVGNSTSTITNSYAAGTMIDQTTTGIVGNSTTSAVINSYWDKTTNSGTSTLGTAYSTATMIDQINFQNNFNTWDFNNIWTINPGYRPILRALVKNFTVTANDVSKTYNGTTSSSILPSSAYSSVFDSTLTGMLNYTGASQLATNAGTYKITPGGLSANNAQYVIKYVDGTLTINQAPITITTAAVTKSYDGTTIAAGTATVASASDILYGIDALSGGTFTYNNANVGLGTIVTPSNVTVGSGFNNNNYNISYLANTASSITTAGITINVTNSKVQDKVYDSTLTAKISGGFLSGVLAADLGNVSLNEAGTFASKNVGQNIAVTAADSLTGSAARNYSIIQPIGLTGNITPATVTITGTVANNKIYDTTTATNLTAGTLNGVYSSDSIGLTQSGLFADKNVANGKSVVVTSSLTGNNLGNYSLTQIDNLSANITPAAFTVNGATAIGRTYNGTTLTTITGGTLVGVLTSATGLDDVQLTQLGTFASKNVGVQNVSANISGADIGNYSFTQPANLTANITPAGLFLTTSDVTKVFDGNVSALGTAIFANGSALFSGDSISGGSFAFTNANVGINKTVLTSAVSVNDGNGGANYSVNYVANGGSSITALPPLDQAVTKQVSALTDTDCQSEAGGQTASARASSNAVLPIAVSGQCKIVNPAVSSRAGVQSLQILEGGMRAPNNLMSFN